jgi:hypothetical protein
LDAFDLDEALFPELSDLVVKRSKLVAHVIRVNRSERADGPQEPDVIVVQSIVVTAEADVVTLATEAVKTGIWPRARVAPAFVCRPLAAVISTAANIVTIVPSVIGHGSLAWERVRRSRRAKRRIAARRDAGGWPASSSGETGSEA